MLQSDVHSSTDNLVITACLNVMWVSVYSVHRYVVSSISNLVAAILGNTEALFGQMIARDEQDAIKRDVPMYDLMSKMLSTVFFFTCIILITPFVSLYTGGIIMIVALIASMAVLWYGKQKRGAKKMLAFTIGVIVIAIFMQTPFYNDLLQTVQGASASDIKNGVYDNTMSVRVYSLEMLRKNWNGKPAGLAFFGTSAFKHYFTIGSNDDLGYLGNWYTMGWYCVPMIVLLVTGYFYTSIRNFRKNNTGMRYTILIYLLITGISLSCFDLARIDVIPFLLFILQGWKWNRNELEVLEYDS